MLAGHCALLPLSGSNSANKSLASTARVVVMNKDTEKYFPICYMKTLRNRVEYYSNISDFRQNGNNIFA